MYIKREIEDKILSWIEDREIIAIIGPRQAGKTTLMKNIEKILSKEHGKEFVHYLTLEDRELLAKLSKNPKEVFEYYISLSKGKHYFLIDEIQLLRNAGEILKYIFDAFENTKIIISGSSSFEINKLSSFLVGRVIFFELFPFSFSEFLLSKNKRISSLYNEVSIKSLQEPSLKETVYLDNLNSYLKEYLTFGGYPRVVLENNIEKKKTILKNIAFTHIRKDILFFYDLAEDYKLIDLLKLLSSSLGGILNYSSISSSLSFNHRELLKVLNLLRSSYIIDLIRPYHKNLSTELRKSPKIYFIDSGLRNYLFGKFDFTSIELGHLLENYTFNCIRSLNPKYWRTTSKAEVDFVVDEIPIEVKTTNPKPTRSLRSFISAYSPKKAFIVSLNNVKKEKINSTILYTLPAAYLRRYY